MQNALAFRSRGKYVAGTGTIKKILNDKNANETHSILVRKRKTKWRPVLGHHNYRSWKIPLCSTNNIQCNQPFLSLSETGAGSGCSYGCQLNEETRGRETNTKPFLRSASLLFRFFVLFSIIALSFIIINWRRRMRSIGAWHESIVAIMLPWKLNQCANWFFKSIREGRWRAVHHHRHLHWLRLANVVHVITS